MNMLDIRVYDTNIINVMSINDIRNIELETTFNQELFNNQLELIRSEFEGGSIFNMSNENTIYVYVPTSCKEFNNFMLDKFEGTTNFVITVTMCGYHYCTVLLSKSDNNNILTQKEFCVIYPDFIKLICSIHDTSIKDWNDIQIMFRRNRIFGAARASVIKNKFKNFSSSKVCITT